VGELEKKNASAQLKLSGQLKIMGLYE